MNKQRLKQKLQIIVYLRKLNKITINLQISSEQTFYHSFHLYLTVKKQKEGKLIKLKIQFGRIQKRHIRKQKISFQIQLILNLIIKQEKDQFTILIRLQYSIQEQCQYNSIYSIYMGI
ncbi:unnamed protein product [Paramecium sonneborni]|uniref:Uncharacterized protein n=1 Tax=Paramecium sonneborni TaxID=65129 RepID=A0A8S1QHY4_9CILI|nr:unnamed protein product [Paramecium sonneborni]